MNRENIPRYFKSGNIDVSPSYSGEHIRESDVLITFGGETLGFQLAVIENNDSDFENGIVPFPSFSEIGSASPLGLIIRIKTNSETETISKSSGFSIRDLEAVIEKKIGDFVDQISGVSHQYIRDKIVIQVSKEAAGKGFTFEDMAAVLESFIIEEFPFVSAVSVQIMTDETLVQKELEKARMVYAERDRRALSLHDEDVPVFYGCRICQISSPAHVCVITPDRPSVCGTINWFEAGASFLSNPGGSSFQIEKGELTDAGGGEYSGVSKTVAIESGGETDRLLLYSLVENPHTTGSVFDIIAFYIPEFDGIGLADREFKKPAVNCLSFEDMMIFTGYGQQISGFSGISEMYMLSDKFFQKEGGWENVIWMSSSLKKRILEKIQLLSDRSKADKLIRRISDIPTENEAESLKELEPYCKEKRQ